MSTVSLRVADQVFARVTEREGRAVPGVRSLHTARIRGAARAVEVRRDGGRPSVSVRLVTSLSGPPVLDVIGTVQRAVHDRLLAVTGEQADVAVVVADAR